MLDLTNKKYNKLTVLRFNYKKTSHNYWICKCDCGKEISIREYQFVSGIQKSCKYCRIPLDLTGKKFGLLAVIGLDYKKDGEIYWKCKCDCGNETSVITYSLTKSMTKSCGCLKKLCKNKSKLWKGYGEISGHWWNALVNHAKERKLKVDVTLEYLWNLFLKQNRKCNLSGLELSFGGSYLDNKNKVNEKTASLDRIDSTKGYVQDNVQWVHKDINWMKTNFNNSYFISMCKKIAEYNSINSIEDIIK
jgi:hypothetical protein